MWWVRNKRKSLWPITVAITAVTRMNTSEWLSLQSLVYQYRRWCGSLCRTWWSLVTGASLPLVEFLSHPLFCERMEPVKGSMVGVSEFRWRKWYFFPFWIMIDIENHRGIRNVPEKIERFSESPSHTLKRSTQHLQNQNHCQNSVFHPFQKLEEGPYGTMISIEYWSVISSNFRFCISTFSWPYFSRTWWKTLTPNFTWIGSWGPEIWLHENLISPH